MAAHAADEAGRSVRAEGSGERAVVRVEQTARQPRLEVEALAELRGGGVVAVAVTRINRWWPVVVAQRLIRRARLRVRTASGQQRREQPRAPHRHGPSIGGATMPPASSSAMLT